MAIVHMMIGIPGSGKTTIAKKLAAQYNMPIISTDELRSRYPTWSEALLWPEVYRLCATWLKQDRDIIFDATNINRLMRSRFDQEVQKYNVHYQKKAYLIITSVLEASKRVLKRNENKDERFLPIEVVALYDKKLQKPSLEEGFIDIIEWNNE